MRSEFILLTCDCCSKQLQYIKGAYQPPVGGWIHAECRTGKVFDTRTDHDLCSAKCAIKFFGSEKFAEAVVTSAERDKQKLEKGA